MSWYTHRCTDEGDDNMQQVEGDYESIKPVREIKICSKRKLNKITKSEWNNQNKTHKKVKVNESMQQEKKNQITGVRQQYNEKWQKYTTIQLNVKATNMTWALI